MSTSTGHSVSLLNWLHGEKGHTVWWCNMHSCVDCEGHKPSNYGQQNGNNPEKEGNVDKIKRLGKKEHSNGDEQ